ncbi:putative ABC transporter permease [Fusobacterium sp. MFO224]|uniref:putative ABC transporter permease n=1 Tax=Fusobacterium sp. MFO224 TaxID=3378070 RepID=UPI003854E7CB
MGDILKYSLIFVTCSVTGWVIELIYRRYWGDAKKFINPGFLYGPYLPIYGFGGIVLYIFSGYEMNRITRFFVIALSMTLMEYIAGLIILKYYKIRLWDYRDEPFNYRGLICLRYTVYWGILGELFYVYVNPILTENVSFLFSNLSFSYFLGIFFGFLIIDVIIKFNLMSILRGVIDEIENKDFTLNMDTFKIRVGERRKRINLGFRIIPTFHSINIREVVKDIAKEKRKQRKLKKMDKNK